VRNLPFKMIAPQHGQIIPDPTFARRLIDLLARQTRVGIDALLFDDPLPPAP